MFNLTHKITKRLHPWPLIQYDLRKNWRGFRKHGGGIDCHMADHIHVYMTLRCQYNCSFCINKILTEPGKLVKYSEQKDPGAWIYWLNRLKNVRELYFNGGEHFNLPYFADVINGLRGFNINIFSNLPRKGLHGIRALKRNNNNIIIRGSFHPISDEPLDMFVDRYRQIPKGILKGVNIIRDVGISVDSIIATFHKYGIHAMGAELVKPDISTMKRRVVKCNSMEHIIGPDLRVFRCIYNLVNNIGGVHIYNYDFKHREKVCSNYPKCFASSCAYAKIRL